MKDTHLTCSCTSDEHTVRLTYFEDQEYYPDLYMHYFLDTPGFWGRVKLGLRYIFGYKCKYGHFGETIFTLESALKFRDVLEQYIHDYRTVEMNRMFKGYE